MKGSDSLRRRDQPEWSSIARHHNSQPANWAAHSFASGDARRARVALAPAWAARLVHAIDALDVPFMSWDDLVRNKRATGRDKDLGDIEALGEDPDGAG